jgi:hypothetical protein
VVKKLQLETKENDDNGLLTTERLMDKDYIGLKKFGTVSEKSDFNIEPSHFEQYTFKGSNSLTRFRSPKKKIIKISNLITQEPIVSEANDFNQKGSWIQKDFKVSQTMRDEHYERKEGKYNDREMKDQLKGVSNNEELSTGRRCCFLFC